ncbi:hypothetical protein RMSM_03519 [Rhodopirellula maiorica SM1]|uniref:Uncharacterized protein n=1 Tax=Rhodopirellula maiorica SM1 TaxID=1265738 RepID=M5S059_9BACT|nr:hypothetical protein [Rhodopirellula maiorica]EMI19559.1 hypothetical protein RMSM_03519 [Rhodopirellula maiorica SM1]
MNEITRIDATEISTNKIVEDALAMMREKLSDAADIIQAANGAGLDYKREPTIEIITQPDGTVIKRVTCLEEISLDPV